MALKVDGSGSVWITMHNAKGVQVLDDVEVLGGSVEELHSYKSQASYKLDKNDVDRMNKIIETLLPLPVADVEQENFSQSEWGKQTEQIRKGVQVLYGQQGDSGLITTLSLLHGKSLDAVVRRAIICPKVCVATKEVSDALNDLRVRESKVSGFFFRWFSWLPGVTGYKNRCVEGGLKNVFEKNKLLRNKFYKNIFAPLQPVGHTIKIRLGYRCSLLLQDRENPEHTSVFKQRDV